MLLLSCATFSFSQSLNEIVQSMGLYLYQYAWCSQVRPKRLPRSVHSTASQETAISSFSKLSLVIGSFGSPQCLFNFLVSEFGTY